MKLTIQNITKKIFPLNVTNNKVNKTFNTSNLNLKNFLTDQKNSSYKRKPIDLYFSIIFRRKARLVRETGLSERIEI